MDQEWFYDKRSAYSAENANRQLKRYQYKDNRFPLLVLGRKSPLQFYRELLAIV